MRDARMVNVRLNQKESQWIQRLSTDQQVSVSELVREWLKSAARQAKLIAN